MRVLERRAGAPPLVHAGHDAGPARGRVGTGPQRPRLGDEAQLLGVELGQPQHGAPCRARRPRARPRRPPRRDRGSGRRARASPACRAARRAAGPARAPRAASWPRARRRRGTAARRARGTTRTSGDGRAAPGRSARPGLTATRSPEWRSRRREDMPGRKRRARGASHLGVRPSLPIAFGAVWIGRPVPRHALLSSHPGGARRRARRRRRARGLGGGLERALPRGARGTRPPPARRRRLGPLGGRRRRRGRSVRWA